MRIRIRISLHADPDPAVFRIDRDLKNTDPSAFCFNLLKKYRHQQKIDTNLVKKFHNQSNNKIIKFVEKRLEKCEALKKITYAQLWWVGREYVNPIS